MGDEWEVVRNAERFSKSVIDPRENWSEGHNEEKSESFERESRATMTEAALQVNVRGLGIEFHSLRFKPLTGVSGDRT